MKRTFLLYSFLLVFTCSAVWAQEDTSAVKEKPVKFKLRKEKKVAKKQLLKGSFYSAEDQLERILEERPDQVKLAYQLAETYYFTRDYKSAEKWFAHVAENDPEKYPLVEYWWALMMKMNGKYAEAQTKFAKFSKSYKGEDQADWRKWARVEKEGCELAQEWLEKPENVNMNHLDATINSAYTDISPLFWDDTTLMYSSLPVDAPVEFNPTGDSTKPSSYLQFYASVKKNGVFQPAAPFDIADFNDPNLHMGNGAFSPKKDRFYFTICEDQIASDPICNIYVSKKEGSGWSEPEMLGNGINDSRYTNTQPTLGNYKNGQEVLYFVTDRTGGKGGRDIWYSIIRKDGSYKTPRNCGSRINSNRDEATPHYDNSTGTLYFSTEGRPGMGGYDVFKAFGKLSKWTDIENLGYPINSQCDDMYFSFNKSEKSGFVVSNRPGIISIKSETCCDDIFTFEYYNTIDIAVKGLVYDEEYPETPLNGANVGLTLVNYKNKGEDIRVNDDQVENDQPYFFDINKEEKYKLTASADTYLTSSSSISTKGMAESDTLVVNFYLKRLVKNKAYRLKNIYYDYDKWDLRPESKLNLDSLYSILIENPQIIIELSSHTDSRGTEGYNEKLSQRRAESCVKYLIEKGIKADRMVAKGYGENDPIEDCAIYQDCPEEGEGDCPCHQKNRRTQFRITGENELEVIYDEDDEE